MVFERSHWWLTGHRDQGMWCWIASDNHGLAPHWARGRAQLWWALTPNQRSTEQKCRVNRICPGQAILGLDVSCLCDKSQRRDFGYYHRPRVITSLLLIQCSHTYILLHLVYVRDSLLSLICRWNSGAGSMVLVCWVHGRWFLEEAIDGWLAIVIKVCDAELRVTVTVWRWLCVGQGDVHSYDEH